MPDYLFLMHRIAEPSEARDRDLGWDAYLAGLRATGRFQGGSAIGAGVCIRKSGEAPAVTDHLSGFIRVSADDMDDARSMLAGNPVFEAGGTVEIRELPRTGQPPRSLAPFGPAPGLSQRGVPSMANENRFEHRAIDDAVFRDCAIKCAQFDDVDLSGAVLTNVNLRGARLENVNLAGATINDANIAGLTIHGHDIEALIRAEAARRKGGT